MLYTMMFWIIRDLADNECPGGKLQIHVRLWADEYYAGPTAYTTHKWISDKLGDMTIDIRSENISSGRNGGGDLQNPKAGMKLMTLEQVRELPGSRVILLLEGQRPIYDLKNRPFHTTVWQEAEKLAGKKGAKGQAMDSGKQPAGLKLTSGSGEQTFYEVPLLANRGRKNLYLIDTRIIVSWVLANRLIQLSRND